MQGQKCDDGGKLTDGNGEKYYRQNADYGEILAADKKNAVPKAYKFNRLNTNNHIRHAKELGYKNQAEYEKAAAEFFNSKRGKLYIDKHSEKLYRYEEQTRLLVVVDRNGGICTFYRSDNKTYFERKRRQEGLNEIE